MHTYLLLPLLYSTCCCYQIAIITKYKFGVFTDPDGNMHNLVLVAYKYDGILQDTILVNSHGNSREKEALPSNNGKYKEETIRCINYGEA